MRLIIAGTRSFGTAALKVALRDGHEVAYVVSPPDDQLANVAMYDCQIPVRAKLDPDEVADAHVDLILGVHTHVFVGARSRANTALGALIGHPSLLPRHRGRDSVEWTVRMGDPVTGFSYFWADRNIDTGPIQSQDWCFVDRNWSASDLWRERLFPIGLRLLSSTLVDLDAAHVRRVPQNKRFATTEPSLDPAYLHRSELLELSDRPYAGETFASR